MLSRKTLIAAIGSLTVVAAVTGVITGYSQRRAAAEAAAELARASAHVKRSLSAPVNSGKQPLRPIKVCPRGAEGLGNSARRSIRRKLLTDAGNVNGAALAQMSNIAIASARYLERAHAAPALPQRLGRQRVNPPGNHSHSQWEPLKMPQVGCALVPRNRR